MNLLLADFFDKMQVAFEQEQAFVVYKKPNQTIIKVQFQRSNELISDFNFNESGFIFAPFDDKKSSLFFPLEKSAQYESEFLEDEKSDQFYKTSIQRMSLDKEFHLKLVDKAIEAIDINKFQKIVVSRKEDIVISDFDLIKTYKSLLQKYRSAMVYCWYHPEVGLWMGATPEILCKTTENHFSTVALAGTQVAVDNGTVVWGEKEKTEQQLVTDFIANELKSVIPNLRISKPYSVKAGHLWHIKTTVESEISSNVSIENIIQKLHPTPAICGLPKKSSKEFILKNEGYDREFYTGYLGELNVNSATELFVNLRCMKIVDKNISIFVGGGITKESIPEKEWEETVSKAETMKSCFY